MEDSSKSREHGMSLFLHRRKITADAAKSGGPRRTAKGARNLLLHFRPAQVPLGLVVGKRNAQVVEQRQRLQVGTIVDWRADRSGKAAQASAVTGGATD